MNRDWDSEERILRAKVAAAFACLMGVQSSLTSGDLKNGLYGADEALNEHKMAEAKLAAFLKERRAGDPSWREV